LSQLLGETDMARILWRVAVSAPFRALVRVLDLQKLGDGDVSLYSISSLMFSSLPNNVVSQAHSRPLSSRIPPNGANGSRLFQVDRSENTRQPGRANPRISHRSQNAASLRVGRKVGQALPYMQPASFSPAVELPEVHVVAVGLMINVPAAWDDRSEACQAFGL
jgi:hypothetical protein